MNDRLKAWPAEVLQVYRDMQVYQINETRSRFQSAIVDWVKSRFSYDPTHDPMSIDERNRRFLEEALELVQSRGMKAEDIQPLIDHVFSRPPGEPKQEIGGVLVCLAAVASQHETTLHDAEVTEFSRLYDKPIEHFQQRHQQKRDAGI